ncbi:MAG TPA: hypothetical protein VL284_20535 [Thermoanaerobaculia bacterium]|nr:hypothetical protein [Thermoanaerobaculia bacterium]
MKSKYLAVQLAAILALGLMCGSAFAQNNYRADRISTQGTITRVTRQGDMFQVTLDHGAYTYYVPVATVGPRNLAVGERVRIDGLVAGDVVNSDMIALANEPYFSADPYYHGVPFGQNGWMSATVTSINRHLGYMWVRDDSTGVTYKVDVRHMNTRRPVNVWGIRKGDHISVDGNWENRNTFDAVRIEY